ncbi:dihydrofolate reductase [Nocardioides sp. Kera G14]|uniref:dihydrofolate reductase n=1 Tax=Nocardioides sp. Kera G14 TaxID=2884264 RepID=UPI001D10BC6F|nr:dihydrofolate reductase [Nocardioides sp. Kera G14]UDY25060.1 dihydrofolate reductase [Nocardioides sp. Kera G14]
MSEAPDYGRVVFVCAIAQNGVIGNGPDIPWKIPGEQAQFKELTMGHTLVMGRTTFESIGRPLPGRTTVVVTRDPSWSFDGVEVAHSIESALSTSAGLPGDTMVIGGAQVFASAFPYATEQVLTMVDVAPEGDVLYPPYDESEWLETLREPAERWTRIWLTRA